MEEIQNYTDSSKAPFRGLGGIKEAIILAGGLGTRLKDTVPDLPKCMAPVAGRPFLFYVINYLRSQGIEKFIFATGYMHEIIEEYLNDQFSTLNFECSVEKEPLGTGGAIQLALSKASSQDLVIANGDTLYRVDLHKALLFHTQQQAESTILLKPMINFDRYGVVEINADHLVDNFAEKQFYQKGNINGGIYLLNKDKFLDEEFPAIFSFEIDYLEKALSLPKGKKRRIVGQVQDEYFIDIGIPEDYNRAQIEFVKPPLDLEKIDKTWTLFLDRDGVINEDKIGSYILNPDEFIFMKGAPGLFKKLTEKFGHIIVVTNQRGVGRGLMSEEDLAAIHEKMLTAINAVGGKIDAIYFATSIENKDPVRKPNPGMAFRAKADLPSIDLSRSIVAGNHQSDMLFGKNAGMYTVFIASTNPETAFPHPDIDLRFDGLQDFVKALPAGLALP
ncbi:MAG TPA: HAD-IIIA family hydrolase [Chitinophagaceae bacterium]|nr:HAD-IIIA family hydrolase [Chitinophagaceae bacterium]